MGDWHGIIRRSNGGGRSMRDGDFQEEDVWAILKEKDDSSPKMRKSIKDLSGSSSAWCIPTAPKMISRNHSGIVSQEPSKVIQQSSAPLNIPDWSKIYGKNGSWVSKENGDDVSSTNTNSFMYYSERDFDGIGGEHNDNGDDDDDDDDDELIPPHEWIARKLARSQIYSFSVCEGIGRTLKGRDLSKVRNAALTKTGFLE